jgi:uncharacterized protein (TIGR03000 family)
VCGGTVISGGTTGGTTGGEATGGTTGGATGGTTGGTAGKDDSLTAGTALSADEDKWLKEMMADEKDPKERKKLEDDFKKANRVERKATYEVWKKMKSGGEVSAAPATLVVSVPANAKVSIDGEATRSTAATRTFVSPPLQQGKKYHYTLQVEYSDNVTLTRTVPVYAGGVIRLNLESAPKAVASK